MTAESVRALFQPRSLAIVGATERAFWFHLIADALVNNAFQGKVHLINRNGTSVRGYPGFKDWAGIGEPVDAAFLMVPTDVVLEAFEDAITAGVRSIVVLSSGFAEIGEDGKRLQDRLVAIADEAGVRFLGPNSMGFADVALGLMASAFPAPTPVIAGGIAIVSQSGAMASEMINYAHQCGAGVSFLTGTGNEASVTMSEIVRYLVDHEPTRVIAIWAESIRDPAMFRDAARAAFAVEKPIVILKGGSSALSALVALSHTGSLVGNDQTFEAICKAYNVIRVHSIEDLVTTAHILDCCFPIDREGVAVVSISGGACTLTSDLAEPHGVPLPQPSPAVVAELKTILPSFASSLNPLDMTGVVVGNPEMFEKTVAVLSRDPGIGLVVAVTDTPLAEVLPRQRLSYQAIAKGLEGGSCRGAILNVSARPILSHHLAALREAGAPPAFAGLDGFMRGVGKAIAWQRQLRASAPPPEAAAAGQATAVDRDKTRTEHGLLELLSRHGVPVVPMRLARSADEAADAATDLAGPVVLKILSKDIAHKTEVGGVMLDIEGPERARVAYEAINRAVAAACPGAEIAGTIVAPMRRGHIELLVGITRDPDWGLMLAIGLGGIWAEALNDTSVRPLPVTRQAVLQMLAELRGRAVLGAHRGRAAVAMDGLVDAIVAISDYALTLGPDLQSLEINPLGVSPDRVEALDALAVWANPPVATDGRPAAI